MTEKGTETGRKAYGMRASCTLTSALILRKRHSTENQLCIQIKKEWENIWQNSF